MAHMEEQTAFLRADQLSYKPLGWIAKDFVREKESSEYGAATFALKERKVRFCVAKITPTKVGQFVTLWKREDGGPIVPFDKSDRVDLYHLSKITFSFLVLLPTGHRLLSSQLRFEFDLSLQPSVLGKITSKTKRYF